LAESAERIGLIQGHVKALVPLAMRHRPHDPGRALLDLAATLAEVGECIAVLATFQPQPDPFAQAASTPATSPMLDSIESPLLERLQATRVRAIARVCAWL
jgi:hypothetical protein